MLAIAAVGFVAGVTEGVFEVIWITALQERVTAATLARVSSYDSLGSFVFMPLGFAIAGPAAESFGTREVLFVAAGLAFVSSLLVAMLPSVRGFRRVENRGYNVV